MKTNTRILIAVVMFLVGDVARAAVTYEDLLATPPKDVRGVRRVNQSSTVSDYNHTEWKFTASGVGGKAVIIWTCNPRLTTDYDGNNLMLAAGQYVYDIIVGFYYPTQLFVDATRPDEIAGGTWEFGTTGTGVEWKWTENDSSTEPEQEPKFSPLVGSYLNSALIMERSASRTIKGKNPRKAAAILSRMRGMLEAAKIAAE